ncbi:PPC domain-containing DNA-binding protein [Gulosibacter sp. ACHW.36C]|uniref:DNA-binding protein n=1 Tax=Gulosibacter sediminis TaxID=1729695 RepID=A0ABY4MW94_9MICO|nr:PPC domain-containing DNA-binding protein [Gulosibacter sediminis]UQN14700.1 DNA-binding protein [Gulosibacter sediminis]
MSEPTGNYGTRAIHGDTWTAREITGGYVLSVHTGNELVAAVTEFVASQGISGGSIEGVGAVARATLRFRDPVDLSYIDREFDEQMEIVALQGNVSLKADVEPREPLVHLHITLGRADYTALAGHLKETWVNGACEIVIRASEATYKTMDDSLGLNIYALD